MLVKTYQSLKKTKSYYIFCGNNWSFQLRDWQVVKNKISESRTTFQQFNDARLIWTYVKTEG